MKITWLGHSCFKIESNNESIIIDPYADHYVTGLAPLREEADLVLCSHGHGDHNAKEVITVSNKPTHFNITTIESFHDDKQGTLRGLNTIHIIDDGTTKVAHLGDLGCDLTDEQIKQLKGIDVVLIPVGGHYTIDYKQAYDITKEIEPKIVIPMHYRGDNFGFDVLSTVDEFTSQYEVVVELPSNELEVSEEYNNTVIVLSL